MKLQHASHILSKAGIETAALDASLLLAHALGVSRAEALAAPVLTASQQATFETLIARRAMREPLSHILGVREFYGREFIVSRDVLDPRPDSETLIDAVLAHTGDEPKIVLDLGTGSGCLLLTLLCERHHWQGIGVDISEAALAVAQQNAKKLGLEARTAWLLADMGSAKNLPQADVLISNPPYIASHDIAELAPEVAQFEPKIALDGGKEGLDCYRKLVKELPRLLRPQGFVALEIGHTQAGHVTSLLFKSGFFPEVVKDLSGLDRVIFAQHKTQE